MEKGGSQTPLFLTFSRDTLSLSFLHVGHSWDLFNSAGYFISDHFYLSPPWTPSSASSRPRALRSPEPAMTPTSLATRVGRRERPRHSRVHNSPSLRLVFAWYHQHSLPVTPLNPRAASIQLPSQSYDTVASPKALPAPSQTSLSVVTPPGVTLPLLQEAHSVGIPAVWLQPGTFDEAVLSFARSHFEAVVAGEGGNGGEGWCVLVDGEEGLEAAGVAWRRQKL